MERLIILVESDDRELRFAVWQACDGLDDVEVTEPMGKVALEAVSHVLIQLALEAGALASLSGSAATIVRNLRACFAKQPAGRKPRVGVKGPEKIAAEITKALREVGAEIGRIKDDDDDD